MTAARINENNIFAALNVCSWCLLALLTLAGLIFGSQRFAAGLAAGGILAILNYYWLRTILERVLSQRPGHAGRFVQIRYVLRLALLALVIYWLITHGGIDIVGLLVGLSVIVIIIMALSIYMLTTKGE